MSTAERDPPVETVAGEVLLDVDVGEEDEPTTDVPASTLPETDSELKPRVAYLDYLRSPIVKLEVGSGEEKATLFAHQALLVQSPYFADICKDFTGAERHIELPDEDLDAVSSFLEYLYNGEYFPRRVHPDNKSSALEDDPRVPTPDASGVALLRHARLYTLADKFDLPKLKSLAHSKIHSTSSTATGEIAYARYVYRETSGEDATLRKPVAAFWAARSHVLRHEAEGEFRRMCLEFPQFGFDVLSLILDQREKHRPAEVAEKGGRKRARVSHT